MNATKHDSMAHTLHFVYVRKNARPNLLDTREIRKISAPLFVVTVQRCETYKRCVSYHGAESGNSIQGIDLITKCLPTHV